MGTSDPDLYKAFCWRFWKLICQFGGQIGVVLPRSALSAKGSTEFRQTLLNESKTISITMILNSSRWFFEDVHPQYTIGLLSLERGSIENSNVYLAGPYSSREKYKLGIIKEPTLFYGQEISKWNDSASFPLLPTDEAVSIFKQLRKSPRLDQNEGSSWATRPYGELHAGNDQYLMDTVSEQCPHGYWPVFKGESFDIWNADTGTYYAWADPNEIVNVLYEKRLRGYKRARSVFNDFDIDWIRNRKTLPCLHNRIAFRDVTRATDTRTVRPALLPGEIFTTDKAPYLLWPKGNTKDQSYLLGVLCSLAFDWFARRYVETGMKFYLFNSFPVPRPIKDDPLYQRTVLLSGRLACPDDRYAQWADKVGVDCGSLALEEKEDMIHELDSVVAHLYGLSEKQLIHVFETFHEGWDFEERLRNTLIYFNEWKNKL